MTLRMTHAKGFCFTLLRFDLKPDTLRFTLRDEQKKTALIPLLRIINKWIIKIILAKYTKTFSLKYQDQWGILSYMF